MARARGANSVMALAFASTYGAIPGSGYMKMPFAQSNLGEEQGLIESDLLGAGREALPPSEDVVNNEGDITVPVDLRRFGVWLKMLLGAPTTTQGVAASGSFVFTAQPANNATISIGGQAITFVTGTPVANQVKIGATLKETLQNAVWHLNASAVAAILAQTYALNLDGNTIVVTSKTIGTGGNSVALAASTTPASNATASAATLAGGSASGPYNHVFSSGALSLPDAAIEIGQPDVPAFSTSYGAMLDRMVIALQRSGHLNATLSLVCQGETDPVAATTAGTPSEATLERFVQAIGLVSRQGVPLGEVVSGRLSISNGLEKAENIRPDGRIDGADPAQFSVTPQLVLRFADTVMQALAASKAAVDVSFGWSLGAGKSLTFRLPSVRLPPKAKRPITGPGGIQATYEGMAQRHDTLGKTLIVTLVNDVASY
jgi:hypothetical protein